MTQAPAILRELATLLGILTVYTAPLAVAYFATLPATAQADTARCGTDSECAALPECRADLACDGGPEPAR